MTQASAPSEAVQSAAHARWLDTFMRISELVLEWPSLPRAAGRVYLDIVLRATPPRYAPGDMYEGPGAVPTVDPHPMDVLADVYAQAVQQGDEDLAKRFMALVGADVTLAGLVRNIMIVWLNGYLGGDMPGVEGYAAALVWQVIGATPPGLPGPYYGYWAYPAEQPVEPPAQPRRAGHARHTDAKRKR